MFRTVKMPDLSDTLSMQQGNEKVLVGQIRSQFKANLREVDDDKVSPEGLWKITALRQSRWQSPTHCAFHVQIKEQKEA